MKHQDVCKICDRYGEIRESGKWECFVRAEDKNRQENFICGPSRGYVNEDTLSQWQPIYCPFKLEHVLIQ